MRIAVIGCGRWGSLIAWYLDSIGHQVTLYGRESSAKMQRFMKERKNELLTLPETVQLSTDLRCVQGAEVIVISVPSQQLRALLEEMRALAIKNSIFVLCMKGIELDSGLRLSEIARFYLDASCPIAVWLGPGHVQEFYAGIPNCMVIDSYDRAVCKLLVEQFSGTLIRFYYGGDMIGNEIGAAAKNVVGIAAGILDGLKLTTLKGALMSRGTCEVARLIEKMGGNPRTAYGLCHLGDYEATVFSPYSQNRRFGELFVKGERFDKLAEGYYTSKAMMLLSERYAVELPICNAVYRALYMAVPARVAIEELFNRSIKSEFER